MIAFLFIMWHVFHMHGWFHFAAWAEVTEPLGGARFRPYNAASTAADALKGVVVPILYTIGILSCVFHLANGIWTMGITWGVWVTPGAQRWANYVCGGFGVALAFVGMSALGGMMNVDVKEAERIEDKIYEARVESGLVTPNEHKRSNDANEPVSEEGKKAGPTEQPGEGTRLNEEPADQKPKDDM
jgi:succinate dehydrogenase / fumarate reductase cytochrome b subunit